MLDTQEVEQANAGLTVAGERIRVIQESIDRHESGVDLSRWEIGDIVLRECPISPDHARNGSGERLEELAKLSGLAARTLHEYRNMSARFPDDTRVSSGSYKAYREIRGQPDEERAAWVGRFREQPDYWTRTRVAQALGRPPLMNSATRIKDHATPEAQAQLATELLSKPDVQEALSQDESSLRAVDTAQQRSWQQRADRKREEMRRRGPPRSEVDTHVIEQKIDSQGALLDLEREIERFIGKVEPMLLIIRGVPSAERDALATQHFLNRSVERLEELVSRLQFLMDHGKTDIDVFFESTLRGEQN